MVSKTGPLSTGSNLGAYLHLMYQSPDPTILPKSLKLSSCHDLELWFLSSIFQLTLYAGFLFLFLWIILLLKEPRCKSFSVTLDCSSPLPSTSKCYKIWSIFLSQKLTKYCFPTNSHWFYTYPGPLESLQDSLALHSHSKPTHKTNLPQIQFWLCTGVPEILWVWFQTLEIKWVTQTFGFSMHIKVMLIRCYNLLCTIALRLKKRTLIRNILQLKKC